MAVQFPLIQRCQNPNQQRDYKKWLLKSLDPTRKKKDAARKKYSSTFGRLGLSQMDLNEHEEVIAAEVIVPEDISVRFEGTSPAVAILWPL